MNSFFTKYGWWIGVPAATLVLIYAMWIPVETLHVDVTKKVVTVDGMIHSCYTQTANSTNGTLSCAEPYGFFYLQQEWKMLTPGGMTATGDFDFVKVKTSIGAGQVQTAARVTAKP